MTKGRLKKVFSLIAIAALVVGFFTLIGSSEETNNAPIIAEQGEKNLEQLVLDAERLSELAPAAGVPTESGDLPSNSDIDNQVFDF